MSIRNTREGYGWLAKLLHWVMAFLIVGLIVLGLYMSGLPRGDDKNELIRLHASTGLLVLMFLIARFTWRVSNTEPNPVSDAAWQVRLAKITHLSFYVVILSQVTTGSLTLLTVGWDVPFFELFSIPTPYERDMELHHFWENMHVFSWYALASLITLHLAAVLYHQFYASKNILKRMI